ncbi:MAG TPA: ABC transporter ATP-binding protein, partial [Opitutaceae bacterium]|nr:ABC transporter ATP-binding protein [Opitutaceae bacterium]
MDLELREGEILALLGPNGAGKSTLVAIIAGLLRPDAGDVRIDGFDALARGNRARAHLGLAPQEAGLYPTISGWDNLRFFGELAGLRRSRLRKKMVELAEALDLESFLDRPARRLSGGEARRLHIGMALMNSPRLVLLDEATSGVDVMARIRILELVRGLAGKGTSVLYCTHHLAEVEELGDRLAILDQGRIRTQGRVQQLLERFGSATLELRFSGTPPILPNRKAEISGSIMRIATDGSLATEAARIIVELGEASRSLQGIEMLYPSL